MGQYATIAEAQAYMDNRLNADPWDDASSADQNKALKMGTTLIDRLNFRGYQTDIDQALQFPRGGDATVPQDIKDANAEIALALLDGVDPELEFENLGMISQGYGNVRATYDRDRPSEHMLAGIPSVIAWRFMRPYLRDPSDVSLTRVS